VSGDDDDDDDDEEDDEDEDCNRELTPLSIATSTSAVLHKDQAPPSGRYQQQQQQQQIDYSVTDS